MTPTKTVLLLAASGLALTLGGCKLDNRPLLARVSGQPPPAAMAQPNLPDIDAPVVGDATAYLAPPPPLPPAGAYPVAERARLMDRIVHEAPPAYGFDYGGVEPWAWQAADDSLMFAEPYGDDYRFYYYEPGATYPYFVRDPGYGYAYGPNGGLVAMFDAAGALIAADQYGRYSPDARAYWSRGYDLQRAYGGGRRYPVDPGAWAARAPRLRQVEQGWIEAPRRQPAWREWRASAQGARFARADLAPPPTAAGPAPHVDNGRHLGWERGRHEGWNRPADRRQIAAAAPPAQIQSLPAREGRGARQDRPHGRGGAPQAAQAARPLADQHGHGHGGRKNDDQPAPQVQAGGAPPKHGGGEGRGRGGPQLAQAPQPQGGQGGGHGHGHGGGPPAPQAQPQGQPQGHGGGAGKGGGGDKGGGKGGGKSDGKGHGHDR